MDRAAPSASQEWRRHGPLVAAATAGMSLGAISTAAFGVMLVPIAEDTGWSRTEISVGPSLISFMVFFFATMAGALIDRIGPRLVAIVSITLLSGLTALLSQIGDQVWQWWAIWAGIGLCSSAMSIVWVAPITKTFDAGRGLAMAVVLSGSGISSFLVPNLANTFIEATDWRTAYLYLAAIWFAVTFTLVVLFLRVPKHGTGTGQQSGGDVTPSAPLTGMTASEGFRSVRFYKLLLATVIANVAGIALMMNLVPILRDTGLEPAAAAAAFSSLGIATIVGRLMGGGLMDRFPANRIAIGAAILMTTLPTSILLFPGNLVMSVGGIFIYGMMGGAMMPSISYLASRHFGQRAFSTLYATIMAVMSLGIGLGPVIANIVFDAVGSYTPVLLASLPMFLIGALLFATLGTYPNYDEQKVEAR